MHLPIEDVRKMGRKIPLLATMFFSLSVSPSITADKRQDRIQEAVDSIRKTYADEDRDYITDGQHIVWVKSYKRWTPRDFPIIKKEAPHVLRFLHKAIEHQRVDVLEQLLPDYYRSHGGVRAFADDIRRTK